jgi:transposase
VEEVTDEPLYRDRVCGIDIGKAGLVATIRVPSDRDPARRMAETRSFGTTRKQVLALADWLRCWQVGAVVMEATSDYWKGPFYRLEAEGFECVLAGAKQVKNLPGLAGGMLRARRDHAVFCGHAGVPDRPAAHPLPAGPDRRTHPGKAARGEAAGISRDQSLQRGH